ncbi:deoxynucleoside triphosphate triphosphohydrolase SAMHD1-like [Anguilla anguilla]|uniref:deoxynucleoside triphosphate triphosphohydrolase SAMHD1-like n=1 Tax=Anguilla anguilla TaxID=7936 RepID=UPI0015AB47B1|nr:deoxynucleoside triphosphate triphosphohydrolase SAMHD1-like [Anguilla anguilla]
MAYKIFNDPIHGSIEMHPYLVRIIDTPEFQRLRYIRQMGSVYFVYPGASHNRFEHSIGVAHLAGELVQELNRRYHPGEDTNLDQKLQEIHEERKKDLTTKYREELGQLEQLEQQEQPTASSSDHQESEPREQYKLEEEHKNQLQKLEAEQHVLITKDEGLCVQIAALCHDLGHGPFSHQFDDLFIPKVVEKLSTELEKGIPDGEMKREKETKKNTLENWTHEKQSKIMLKELFRNIEQKNNKKDKKFIEFMRTHLHFIQELIYPPKDQEQKGKTIKSFLYEIVSNKTNGIDVDKMDYFARDCHHLGIESNFNYRRFFKFARVCVVDNKKENKSKDKSKDKKKNKSEDESEDKKEIKGKCKDKSEDESEDGKEIMVKCEDEKMQICLRDKEVGHIYELYHTRSNIHHKACQHKVVSAIDTMTVDAFLLADETLNISDSVLDATKYRMLTDSIYQIILHYEKIQIKTEMPPDMKTALEILERIESRDLYQCIYNSHLDVKPGNESETKEKKSKHERENELEHELQQAYKKFLQHKQPHPQQEKEYEFAVRIINMESGMKGEDPIKHVKFYSKQDPCAAVDLTRDDVSRLLPEVFSETVIHIFWKNSEMRDNVQNFRADAGFKEIIEKWCEKNQYETLPV